MARAWEEKIIGTAEREHRLAEEEKASRVQAIQSTAQFQVRLHELQSAPGEWFSIVQFAYNRALDTANQIYEITHKEADLRKATLEAVQQRELSIAEYRRRELDGYRQSV